MPRISLVDIAHDLIRENLRSGDIAIDATAGNGHDTLFLAEQISPSGKVYSFDIQQAALEATHARFRQTKSHECLTLIHASHAEMSEKIPARHHGRIRACMFNLGYLPGGDKRLITRTESTLAALTSASQILSGQGIMTVIAYPGHAGGDQETIQVKNWCEQLSPEQFKISIIYGHEPKDSDPRLFLIRKLS
ncbi:putative rRNA methylase [Candidatus Methylobacter favarea]|uniref:Putative rRNA methylase n=1 Tax=Candidatus Methylobacter favarea TaxID=2707345 RepID=A0A8S0Y677_9GAMM|nr:class I SAM-dependent methyltransferase [Candidatus Methylobacter favarea]CAA9890653.1 putative rRNA methylase [Candidatus Methylobacter favarea]